MHLTGNVLIVDDEPHVRLYISFILRTLGPVTVNEAGNGQEGVTLFHTLRPPPSLILLDVNMPGIDGIDTLRRLRAEGASCPIVMLTSLATRQRVEDAIAGGADHYIRKDTPKDEIIAQLKTLLDESTTPIPAAE